MSDDLAPEKIRRNFGKIFGLKFLGEFYLIAPVLVLYYTANGLSDAHRPRRHGRSGRHRPGGHHGQSQSPGLPVGLLSPA